jgi:hypothetical protein
MLFGHYFEVILLGFSVSFRYNSDEAIKLFKKWEKETKPLIKKQMENSKKITKKVASKKSKTK